MARISLPVAVCAFVGTARGLSRNEKRTGLIGLKKRSTDKRRGLIGQKISFEWSRHWIGQKISIYKRDHLIDLLLRLLVRGVVRLMRFLVLWRVSF